MFDSNSFFPPPDTRQDSSLVAALNSLGNPIDEIHELFFEAKRVMPKPVTANFHVDSGRFRNIFRTDRLWNYDSAMPEAQTLTRTINRIGWVTRLVLMHMILFVIVHI